jgi:hypothetical protein
VNAYLERLNWANDARNCEPDAAPVLYLDDGTEVPLPTRWAVCSVCEGKGTHVNPSIDCDGLTAEDFADDPDFAEDYMAGTYDQTCNRCKGRTTERVVDLDKMPADQRAAYEKQCREDAQQRAEERSEYLRGA